MWELVHKVGRAPKNWCFWTVVLEKTLRVPWTARKSNQSILKEIDPEYSLEGLMLKLQYFAHLMWRANSLEKILMLGKIEGRRGREWQRMRWLDGITDGNGHELGQTLGDGEGQRRLACCSPWGHEEWDMAWQLNNKKHLITLLYLFMQTCLKHLHNQLGIL